MDANKDGKISVEEFLASGGTQQQFDRLDLNGDGLLDQVEMTAQKIKKRVAPKATAIHQRTDGQRVPVNLPHGSVEHLDLIVKHANLRIDKGSGLIGNTQQLDTGDVSRLEFVAAGGNQSDFNRFDWDANGTLDTDELIAMDRAKTWQWRDKLAAMERASAAALEAAQGKPASRSQPEHPAVVQEQQQTYEESKADCDLRQAIRCAIKHHRMDLAQQLIGGCEGPAARANHKAQAPSAGIYEYCAHTLNTSNHLVAWIGHHAFVKHTTSAGA